MEDSQYHGNRSPGLRASATMILILAGIIQTLQCMEELTHWGRDKMAAIFQTIFLNVFLEWKCMNLLIKISLEVRLYGSN